MGDPAKLCDVETIGRLAVCKWTIKLCKTRPGLSCVSTKTIVIDALRTIKNQWQVAAEVAKNKKAAGQWTAWCEKLEKKQGQPLSA